MNEKMNINVADAAAAGKALQRWYMSQDMDDGKFVAVAAFLIGKLIAQNRLSAGNSLEAALRDLTTICSTMVQGMIAELDRPETKK